MSWRKKACRKAIDPFTSYSKFCDALVSFIPIVGWLPKYDFKQNFLYDVVAGFTTGIMHIPQGSFAVIALMSGIANEQVMSKYGNLNDDSNQNNTVTGNEGGLTAIEVASTLTFALGILQFIAGLLRLEFLTTYFSDQLVAGYTTGSAVHVFIQQIDDILGVKVPKVSGPGYLFRRVYDLIVLLPEASMFTLIISTISMLFLFVGKDYINPYVNKLLSFKLPIPFEIILIALGAGVSHLFNFNGTYGTSIVGNVPGGMPLPRIPIFSILPECLLRIVGVAVVSIAVHISMAKMLANKFRYKVDSGKEFYALGFSSMLSGFFPVYPTGTALGRTMVNVESGAKTQLSTVFSCLLLLVSILWLGPLLKELPMCILAAIIIMALRSMFMRLSELKQLWPVSKVDFYIWIFAFTVTVAVDVMEGLALSILFALLTVIFRFQWPRVRQLTSVTKEDMDGGTSRLTKLSGNSALQIYRFEAPLIFTNVDFFKKSISKALNELENIGTFKGEKPLPKSRYIVLDCSCIPFVDCMGVGAFLEICIFLVGTFSFITIIISSFTKLTPYVTQKLFHSFNAVREAETYSAQVLFAAVNSNVSERLTAMKFFDTVSRESFFSSVNDALRFVNKSKEPEEDSKEEISSSEGLLNIWIDTAAVPPNQ